MYIKFAIPKIKTMIFPGIFRKKKDEVHYIGGAEILPPPLAGEDEAVCIEMLTSDESGPIARKRLIEHNLRLVVYIAKKFDNDRYGTKRIRFFSPEKIFPATACDKILISCPVYGSAS